jgi:hypothetical protein
VQCWLVMKLKQKIYFPSHIAKVFSSLLLSVQTSEINITTDIFDNFFLHGETTLSGPRPYHYRGFKITLRHTTLGRTPGRVIGPTQRPLPDNTQLSQQAKLYNSCGFRTHNPSTRAPADPRLRVRGHRDTHCPI